MVVVVVGARLRLDSGRRLPWDPGEGVAQRLSGSDVTLSIVYLTARQDLHIKPGKLVSRADQLKESAVAQ